MKIDIISKSTLKVTLTAADMNEYKLCYEELTGKGSGCRKALGRLLRDTNGPEGAAMAARLSEDRLFVEAFRRMDGGCMLYVSAISAQRKKSVLDESREAAPIMLELSSQRELGQLCRCLLREKEQGAEFSSRLFMSKGVFRLAVVPENICRSVILRLFGEFGAAVCSELFAAFTEEHFKVLIGENAAETGAKVF